MATQLQGGESLTSRLRAAGRRYQGDEAKSFLCQTLKFFLVGIILLFVADVVFHLGPHERLIALGAFMACFTAVLCWALYLASFRRNRLEHVARLVETLEPSLGSKVINILQLKEQAQNPQLPQLTRELAQEAVDSYSRTLEKIDFRKIARLPKLKKDARRAAIAFGVFALLIGASWSISALETLRYADPYGDHPPYSFTHLAITDPLGKRAGVVYGKSALVRVKATGHDPKELFLTIYDPRTPGRKTTLPMFSNGKGFFSQQIENVRSDLILVAHTARQSSVSQKRLLNVILTPNIEKAFVEIEPPAYTAMRPEEKPLDSKPFKALEGSMLRFRVQSNRPLREGLIEGTTPNVGRTRMEKSGENEVAARIRAAESGRIFLGVTDIAGLESDRKMETLLTVTRDQPPEVSISNPESDCFVCIDFTIDAQVQASDDYGLGAVKVFRGINGKYSEPQISNYPLGTRNARVSAPIDLRAIGAKPGDIVSIYAEAADTSPKTNVVRSRTVNMTIISEEQYNQMLRQKNDLADAEIKYTDLLDRFQARIEEQKRITQKLDQLRKDLAKSGNTDASEQEYEDLLDSQGQNNADLEDLADEMEQFVRQNPVYDLEKDLQKMLDDQASAIRNSTQKNDAQTRELAQQQPNQNSVSSAKQASDEHAKRLEDAMQNARQNVSGSMADLEKMQELMKDFNQFQDLANKQQNLAQENEAYKRRGYFTREEQLAMRDLASKQKGVGDELNELTKKLRDDAKAAESKFPKTSQGGKDLADAIENKRLSPMADKATDALLQAQGADSARLTSKLSSEMQDLLGQNQSGQGGQESELGSYMQGRGMQPGQNYKQMAQTRKYPGGSEPSQGNGSGTGSGNGGGETERTEGNYAVLGSESRVSRSSGAGATVTPRHDLASRGSASIARNHVSQNENVKSVHQQSEAVAGETPLNQYDDLVDQYFRVITK